MEPNTKFKIFLVDDDGFTLAMYEQHLVNLGYEDVQTFTSGSEALSALAEVPQVVFLDYNMDNLSGFDVLKKIKRYNPNIYVVMVSGQDDVKAAVEALKFGAFDYLLKGDNEHDKMEKVLQRISNIQEMLRQSRPTFWRKILTII